MIMSFGRLYFETGYDRMFAPGDLKRSLGLSKEDQDQDSGKPATLIKGMQLEKFSCKVKLLSLFDPRPEMVIKQLEKMIATKRPEKLVLGGKVVGKYRWLLTALDIDYTQVNGSGQIVEVSISLSFEEFVKAGSKKDNADANTAAAPGIGTVKINDTYKAKAPTPEENAQRKRTIMEGRLNKL